MNEFVVDLNKDDYNARPHFQRITVLRTVKQMFTGVIHYKVLVEDDSGYVNECWIMEEEFNRFKENATYDMRAKMY